MFSMKPPVGSKIPLTHTRPPARPMISREMISLWPLPKVCNTPPDATDSPMTAPSFFSTGAFCAHARCSIAVAVAR